MGSRVVGRPIWHPQPTAATPGAIQQPFALARLVVLADASDHAQRSASGQRRVCLSLIGLPGKRFLRSRPGRVRLCWLEELTELLAQLRRVLVPVN